MPSVRRPPLPALGALIDSVWAHDPAALPPSPSLVTQALRASVPSRQARAVNATRATQALEATREHVLPTGATHIALRIGGEPLRVFDHAADSCGHRLGHAVVGGARTAYHVRDVSRPSASVGALLKPGAAVVLLGVPESALAGHHTPLDCLLTRAEIDPLLARLQVCESLTGRLALFEHWLLGRARQGYLATASRSKSALLPALQPVLHPALASAFFGADNPVRPIGEAVAATGLSHRHCIALFRQCTGLTPREWLRLQRFGHALELAAVPSRGWAEIAAASGFADQAHLANTFRAVTGFSPSAWRRRADPATPRHIPG